MSKSAWARELPDAPAAMADLLDASRGPLLPPVRSEIFGLPRLEEHGRSLALTHRAERATWRSARFFPRVRANIRVLREAQAYVGAQATGGHDISPAAEWLLDNFHLIEAQLAEIHENMPRSYFSALPLLQDEPLAGLPRIYGVAWAFVAHTDSAFDETLLAAFLQAYQSQRDLSLGEVWALPTTLRVVLIENLRRLAEREATHQAARELANLCCDRIEALSTEALERWRGLLAQRGVATPFLTQLALRLRDRAAAPHDHVDAWLRAALPDLSAAQAQQNVDQTADNLSVSNAVGSLRALGDANWPDIVARCSPLILLLRSSPVFEAEHTMTRDQTLHGIEQLARRSGRSEMAVARTLLSLLAPGRSDPASASGHWLTGDGRPALLQTLGLGRPWLDGRTRRRFALPLYTASFLLGTWGAVAWLLRHFGLGDGLAWVATAAALMALPASEAVLAAINRLIAESAHPRPLARLALGGGLLPEHRTLVVIPAMLTGTASTAELAHRLRMHHLANPERETQFALLTDWADADSARTEGDAERLDDALQHIDALNAKHPVPPGAPARFILLHREREFSASEQRWIGWERKRGKLERLVDALATDNRAAFIELGDSSRPAPATRYVLTLDSDTALPPGRLRDLVGVAAHPLNLPRLDPLTRRVVDGYGILQPRVVTPLPSPAEVTPFHWLFAGQSGIDPYASASSEVYQDLFGEGSFSGKGLLDVPAMHAVLAHRLPESRVLSHDLIEGALARCAAVSELALIEEAPFHPDVAAARQHRWMRGDWQLLPFLLNPVQWKLGAIQRWKMADNLRRSLVAPGALLLLLLALSGHGLAPLAALALVLAAFTAGPLIGALAGFLSLHRDVAWRHFYQQAWTELGRALGSGLWQLAQLLPQAMLAADAIGRALYRMTVSHRHLLQWTPFAAAQAAQSSGLRPVLRRHRALPVVALGLWLTLLALGTPAPALASALCLLWATAPLALWWAGRHDPNAADTALPERARVHLSGIARDTWRFFERCITEDDHHLPPDNLQTTPHEMLAHRTSPTNIGLYLLSVACAREFGWIDTPEMLSRLDRTLATLAQLQRHRGHFLNWYDTQTLQPLLPMYVSTVDSGNLCGHLLAVAQACCERADAGRTGDDAVHLRAIAATCQALAWEADFAFLYHRQRHLLHIGYRVSEQQLDAGFYDLLASESRLTSLLAIAKGDVPVSHWAALGRPFYAVGATAGLRSWSGSMFEYLMPSLVLDEPHGSVLREACHAALQEQMAYAGAHGVPWGISESAYAACDHTLAYQYAPQGVPRLALRRSPPDELVIAPYATALAALIAPRRANDNFAALERLGARQGLGFIEALDYSPARQNGPGPFTPVNTFMAHHEGMSIVALANVLLDGAPRRWGMADPHLEAVASLLHERAPRAVSSLREPLSALPRSIRDRRTPGLQRELLPGLHAVEPTQLLSNGRYNVSLRPNGAGCSRWGEIGITRQRDDALRDALGSFFYLRWDRQPQAVSVTQHPAPDRAAHYRCVFHADRVCFDAAWPELRAHTTVWVSPEDDIEFRRVEITNLGQRQLEIELLSAFEVTLAEPRADEAHPAFGNLFVRASWQPARQALLFERTPRLGNERHLHMAHFLAEGDEALLGVALQTDRARWQGRNRLASEPLASFDAAPVDGPTTLHTGLDPVCAMALRLSIAPGAKAQLTLATAAGDHLGTLNAVIDKYRQPSHVQRASLMSATLAGIRARTLRLSAEDFAALQPLSTALLMNLTRPQQADDDAVCDRRLLWRFGISGDRPLIGISAGAMQGLGLLRTMGQALRLWDWSAVACDLVVINAEPASYQMALQRELAAMRETPPDQAGASMTSTTLHVLRAEDLSADELGTLHRLARLWLQADGRALPHHVQAWLDEHEKDFDQRQASSSTALALSAAAEALHAPSGHFDAETGAFGFDVTPTMRPRRPWINVLANPDFGCQVSEAGGGYTWALNSRMNQLSAWSNDPVVDPAGEWLLLQDQRTLETWSVSPGAHGAEGGHYRVVHGQGRSHVGHRHRQVLVTATWCVDPHSAVKQVRLRVTNRGRSTLAMRAAAIVEWAMGASRSDRATTRTALHRQRLPAGHLTALLCTQRERAGGFGDGTAFLALASVDADTDGGDWTCDRRECFDNRGRAVLPDHFGQHAGSSSDPCAALATLLSVPAGETVERVFLIGYAATPDAAKQLAATAALVPAAERLEAVRRQWNALLGATTVSTPDPLFDVLVNRWLLYQTVACRLWAKAGFYQAGGATGFRDQLQDTMALAWAAPQMLRAQILLCASRQFPEGDVQHWWHAPSGAGVRTHFSDDLLWLPHACTRWLGTGGDAALLDEPVPFIEAPAIPEGAEDSYSVPAIGSEAATVYEHAARAIDHSLRAGEHGLPLMGTGDWNDGMNRVGHLGRGESVWLGWFLCRVVADFAPVALARGDAERAARWQAAAAGWQVALGGAAWDGDWFTRAFFDDGQPLGSHQNEEARIDLIAQAWSVLSKAAPAPLAVQAMASAERHLADTEAGLLRLLDPPLQQAVPDAGYIQAYPPGVRENGGQYAHAAVWMLMAEAAQAAHVPGAAARAWRNFTWLSPAHRTADPLQGAAYGLEPYVVAGDICSQPPYTGRGGWSWYTGAAGWLHRAAIESIFGLQLGVDELSFAPCLPPHWPQATLTLRRDGRTLHFLLQREGPADLPPGHTRLPPGALLRWREGPAEAWYLVPLLSA